jgi:Bacterial Ig domain
MANTVEFLGMGSVRYGTSITSQTIFFPATAQDGDFLVLQAFADREYPSVPSGWTVQFSTYLANYTHFIIATKVKEAGESNVKITTTSPTGIYGVVSAYKNVKSVAGVTGRWESERLAYSPLINDFSVSQTDTLALILSSFNNANSMTITPPNGFTTLEQRTGTGCRFHISGKQMGSETSLRSTQVVTQTSASVGIVGCFLLMLEPVKNAPPAISLTSPTDNQVLTEGSTYQISGSATDADSGNVVTVKYKIDDGTTYNVTASVSDGTTPLNFSKTLTYLNSRLYDGATPVTPILDDSVTHKLTVWAEDDKGGKSADAVRNFTVLYNQPPQISGSDQDLGSISAPPSINYTVTDIEHYSFTITEKVGDTIIRSFAGTDGKQETLTIPDDIWITLQPDVTHNLTITATDQYGASSTRTYTFKRTVDGIELETRIPLPADAQPYRMVLTLNAQYPQNAVVNVQVCNNGYDENPTWEDATSAVLNGRPYVFTNTTKTALDWGIRIKISILPGA